MHPDLQESADVDRLVLEAACLFLAGERLNIRVGIWEACKALSQSRSSGEESCASASFVHVRSGEEALRIVTNLALRSLVRREKDDLEVRSCCLNQGVRQACQLGNLKPLMSAGAQSCPCIHTWHCVG